MISHEEALEHFEYKNGRLLWKKNKTKRGKYADSCYDQYRRVWFKNKNYRAHQIIFLLVHGKWPKTVDHINRNKLDNRIENLRDCSRILNAINTNPSVANKSGHKGVWWHESVNRWKVTLCGKYIGSFKDKEEAVAASQKARNQLLTHLV